MKNLISLLFVALVTIFHFGCDSPDDKKGRFLLKGNEKLKENDPKSALDFYTEALKIDNNYRDAYYNRALVYQQSNQLELAIKDFGEILKTYPQDTISLFQRSVCLMDNGEFYKSLEDSRSLLEINPKSWRGHFLQGLIYEKMKNLGEAKTSFQKALEYSHENVEILVNMANIEYYLENHEEANRLLDRAETVNPKEPNIFNLRSLLSFENGNYQESLRLIENAISIYPNEPYFYSNRGLYKLFLNQLEEGLADINFSIKQNPKNLFALRNKGIYYVLNGQSDIAVNYLKDVAEKDPGMPMVQEYLEKALKQN